MSRRVQFNEEVQMPDIAGWNDEPGDVLDTERLGRQMMVIFEAAAKDPLSLSMFAQQVVHQRSCSEIAEMLSGVCGHSLTPSCVQKRIYRFKQQLYGTSEPS